jgi:SAM-dependent methyltransferase/mannose-6-phosphate isomerase-like protein (cupin superfamily)
MKYVHSLPDLPSFEGKGVFGYTFGPLNQKDFELLYIDVERGHDTFQVSSRITRTYYIVCGSGYFTIDNNRYDVSSGMVIEVPPKVEYSYSGKMKLIAIQKPPWFSGNDIHTKWNPDVVQGDLPYVEDGETWLTKLFRAKFFGKSPLNAYLRLSRRLWISLPASFDDFHLVRSYGNLVHKLARLQNVRGQAYNTHFFRNRPQLELIGRLAARGTKTDTLKVAVLGCSTGAEAYSIAWAIRTAHPQLKLALHAVDISRLVVEVGKIGAYSIKTDILDRMTEIEIEKLFDRAGNVFTVKSWIKNGIKWHVGDVAESKILDALGPQDIVVANNFLCHMHPSMAESCLRNIARLVRPNGYLIVSGIDLDVRAKVADELGWRPVQELIEEIHEGDPWIRTFWPWHYAGLEPLDKKRRDWERRYAAAFQLVSLGKSVQDRAGLNVAREKMLSGARESSACAQQVLLT